MMKYPISALTVLFTYTMILSMDNNPTDAQLVIKKTEEAPNPIARDITVEFTPTNKSTKSQKHASEKIDDTEHDPYKTSCKSNCIFCGLFFLSWGFEHCCCCCIKKNK